MGEPRLTSEYLESHGVFAVYLCAITVFLSLPSPSPAARECPSGSPALPTWRRVKGQPATFLHFKKARLWSFSFQPLHLHQSISNASSNAIPSMARSQLKPASARRSLSSSPASSYLYRALAFAALAVAVLLFVGAPAQVAAQSKENVSQNHPLVAVLLPLTCFFPSSSVLVSAWMPPSTCHFVPVSLSSLADSGCSASTF